MIPASPSRRAGRCQPSQCRRTRAGAPLLTNSLRPTSAGSPPGSLRARYQIRTACSPALTSPAQARGRPQFLGGRGSVTRRRQSQDTGRVSWLPRVPVNSPFNRPRVRPKNGGTMTTEDISPRYLDLDSWANVDVLKALYEAQLAAVAA